jgi:hypothetical protein
MLGVDWDGYIDTSYVERINLTIRTPLARFIRKGMNFSKTKRVHTKAFDLFQTWYNFIKPHKSLRLKIDSGNRKWFKMTPAMVEGITDHIWSLKELLTFRANPKTQNLILRFPHFKWQIKPQIFKAVLNNSKN